MHPPGSEPPARPVAAPVALSPSRAGDFMTCPLLYRLRVIDKVPEPPSAAATRGTVVHAVLERLFDAPAAQRTPEAARALLRPEWERLLEKRPELGTLFPDDADGTELAGWLADAEKLVDGWFRLEDPTRLEPAERELYVETQLESGLRLRGVVPKRLQLVYLGGGGQLVTYDPDPADLQAVERKLLALWQAIQRALETGEWPANRNRLCDWCSFQALCPAFGGTPPPYPLPVLNAQL